MFIFWDENSPKTGLMLCISVILVLVLLWYINKQEYLRECDRKLYHMHYQAHLNSTKCPRKKRVENMSNQCGTMLEKYKSMLNPEKRIMNEHKAGSALDNALKKMPDPLTLDGLDVKRKESTSDMLVRSLTTADYDGPQQEGMSAPVDDFERQYMIRQDKKAQEIYGEQVHRPSAADSLSIMNV